MLAGMARYAAQDSTALAGIGIDTWAVDYGLLDAAGQLIGNPHTYRDRRTTGMLALVESQVSSQRLYAQTGIQRLPINTLYQLISMRQHGDPQLDAARTLLMMPDLFHYWLTGRRVAEYTNATTTQFFDARERRWATDLLEQLNLPGHILPEVVAPGTLLGPLLPELRDTLGFGQDVPVIARARRTQRLY
jgi:rhamnulokinase